MLCEYVSYLNNFVQLLASTHTECVCVFANWTERVCNYVCEQICVVHNSLSMIPTSITPHQCHSRKGRVLCEHVLFGEFVHIQSVLVCSQLFGCFRNFLVVRVQVIL